MDAIIKENLDNLFSHDKEVQNQAYYYVLAATENPVDWAYEVWDELLVALRDKDNHLRSIAAQILSNLAKSDPQQRILTDFGALLALTKDEKFVTARHSLQAIWKIGVAGESQKQLVVDALEMRYQEAASEKNGTLVRYDIIQDLRNLYEQVHDESIKEKALALIELEEDTKYRKKYATVWRKKINA